MRIATPDRRLLVGDDAQFQRLVVDGQLNGDAIANSTEELKTAPAGFLTF